MQVVVGGADSRPGPQEGLVRLDYVPIATTCAIYEGRLITDPDAEEEALAASLITSVVDDAGRVIGISPLLMTCSCTATWSSSYLRLSCKAMCKEHAEQP